MIFSIRKIFSSKCRLTILLHLVGSQAGLVFELSLFVFVRSIVIEE